MCRSFFKWYCGIFTNPIEKVTIAFQFRHGLLVYSQSQPLTLNFVKIYFKKWRKKSRHLKTLRGFFSEILQKYFSYLAQKGLPYYYNTFLSPCYLLQFLLCDIRGTFCKWGFLKYYSLT